MAKWWPDRLPLCHSVDCYRTHSIYGDHKMFNLSLNMNHQLLSIRHVFDIVNWKVVACIFIFSVTMNFPIVYFNQSFIKAVLEMGAVACFLFVVWSFMGVIAGSQLNSQNMPRLTLNAASNAVQYAAWSAILYVLIGCVIALAAIYLRHLSLNLVPWLGPPPPRPRL